MALGVYQMRARGSRHNKVLIVLYYYYPYVSGVSIYAKRLAEGLASRGYEVTVLTSRFDKTLAEEEIVEGVNVLRRPVLMKLGKGVIMPFFWLDIIRYSRRNDYVNVHLPLPDSGLSSLFIPENKMVTAYHCDIFLGSGFLDKIIGAVSMGMMRVQLRRSKTVISSSIDYMSHSKMRRFLYKTQPIYPPVPAEDFKPLDSEMLFRNYDIADKTIKIGFVGRVVYEKGINYLLEAVPYLQKSLSDFKIIITGDYEKIAGGSIKEQLDDYMSKYPNIIIFTGYLSDENRNRFYSGLDVLVLPSIDPLEAFGMVQVEAMLCGTPVVASNMPGVREVIKKTGYGRLCKIKDPKDIAEQVIEVVKHHAKYAPSRAKVADYFSTENTLDAFMSSMPQ